MTPVYREVHRWAGLPFIWGESDCILVLGEWIAQVRGTDPFETARGTYDSRGSCQRETGFFRDPVGTLDRYLQQAGVNRSRAPSVGDIGVLMARESDGRISPCGALWLGDAWACKGPDRTCTIGGDAGALAIWSVGHAP